MMPTLVPAISCRRAVTMRSAALLPVPGAPVTAARKLTRAGEGAPRVGATWILRPPLVTVWDGYVSNLRTYSPEQPLNLANEAPGYRWETGKLRMPGINIPYLLGTPAQQA